LKVILYVYLDTLAYRSCCPKKSDVDTGRNVL
jgi:hypothetical protein